jgi:hypothetical protein
MMLRKVISEQIKVVVSNPMESQTSGRTIFSEAERIQRKKTKLRGLIRNNITLLNILAGDLMTHMYRLTQEKQNSISRDVNWLMVHIKELTERVTVSFSFEDEDTTEKGKIITIPSPIDSTVHELGIEDDIGASLKIIKDVLVSLSENRDQLCALGTEDPSEGVLIHILFMFDYVAVTMREKLNLKETLLETHSQLGRVLTEVIIIKGTPEEKLEDRLEENKLVQEICL